MLPSLASINDPTQPVEARARAYLHANCSNCHRPEGPTFTPLDLRFNVSLKDMGMCDVPPTIDNLESLIPADPRLFAPGDPARSVLYQRMQTTTSGIRMPPIGRTLTHTAATTVISDWITSTTMCPP